MNRPDTALIENLIDKYGAPLYIYDANKIKENYQKFVDAFAVPKLGLHYACKALSNVAVLQLIKSLGIGLDCVSIQEVKLGLEAGFSPEDILFTPNNISEEEYNIAVELGVNVTIDNLVMLEYFGNNHPKVPICIRMNPHLMAGGNKKISVGHIGSKFGISIYQLPHVERIVHSYKLHVVGVHVHTGSDILDADVFLHAVNIILDVASHFKSLQFVDFGSGFKVAYKKDGLATDIQDLGKKFSKTFNDYCKKIGRELELKFEPGKYLVSNAGYFVTRANVVKQTTSTTFVGIDSGFNHLIRPMFYDSYHHIENISRPDAPYKVYSVVGYICETDTFGVDRKLNEVQKGDLLLFHNAGAYCFSMASNYNSRYRPAEVLLISGKDYLVRKRECFEDIVRNQVMLENVAFASLGG